MKYLVLLFLVKFATAASIRDAIYDAENEIAKDIAVATSFLNALELAGGQPADEDGADDPSETGKNLRESFEKLLQKIKEAVEQGIEVKKDLLDKAKEVKQQLSDLQVRVSNNGRELLESIKEATKSWLQKLMNRLRRRQKRSLSGDDIEITLKSMEKFKETITEMFRKLKGTLLQKVDKEAIKEKIEMMFGKGTKIAEQLLSLLKEKGGKGKDKLLDFIEKMLVEDGRNERSISELWVLELFQKVRLEIEEKYLKFGEWVNEKMGKTIEDLKTKSVTVKEIAKEVKENIETISKEILADALEFLRPYKEDLGELWDQLKDSARKVLDRKD